MQSKSKILKTKQNKTKPYLSKFPFLFMFWFSLFNGFLKGSESMQEPGSMLSCHCCLFRGSFDTCTLLMHKAALLPLAFCFEKKKKEVIYSPANVTCFKKQNKVKLR